MEEIKLFSSINEYEINQVCAILSDNNITFLRKDSGSGSYMNKYMGESIQEKVIYVNENDYEKAKELVSVIVSSEKEIDISEDEKEEIKKYNIIRRVFGFAIISLPVIAIICAIIIVLQNI